MGRTEPLYLVFLFDYHCQLVFECQQRWKVIYTNNKNGNALPCLAFVFPTRQLESINQSFKFKKKRMFQKCDTRREGEQMTSGRWLRRHTKPVHLITKFKNDDGDVMHRNETCVDRGIG